MATEKAADRRVMVVCLVVLATVATAAALYWLRPVMIPFVLAVLLAYALQPLVDLLMGRARLPRGAAIAVALLIGFLVFVGAAGLVSSSVRQLAANADEYAQRIHHLIAQGSAWLAAQGLDVGAENIRAQLETANLKGTLVRGANAVVNMVSNTFLVLVFTIYLLLGHRAGQAAGIWADIEKRIQRYITLKTGLSAATGLLTGVLLGILGVDLAMVFGVLAFLLNFIPSVGSIVAMLLPLPVVLVDPDATLLTVTLVLLLPGSVQLIIGNVIEPKLLGESLEMHPITVLVTLIFWGMLWGVAGMVLATPISAVLKILLSTHPVTRPVADLMAGRFGEPAPAVDAEAPA